MRFSRKFVWIMLVCCFCLVLLAAVGVRMSAAHMRAQMQQEMRQDAFQMLSVLDTAALNFPAALRRSVESESLYLHRLRRAPVVDGYGDEWREQLLAPQRFWSDGVEQILWVGAHADLVYVHIAVSSPDWKSHDPGSGRLISGDCILIRVPGNRYVLRLESPGEVTAYSLSAGDGAGSSGVREPRIRGHLQALAQGYQVEFQIPRSLVAGNLQVSAVTGVRESSELAKYDAGRSIPSLMEPWTEAAQWLQALTPEGQRSLLVSEEGWVLSAGGVIRSSMQAEQQGWPGVVARLAHPRFARWQDQADSGRLSNPELTLSAATGRAVVGWYEARSQRIVRLVVPVLISGASVGEMYLVLERGDSVTVEALSALAGTLLATAILLALILLSLALWMLIPWRIRMRQLTRAVSVALDRHGRVRPLILQQPTDDEASELARHFSRLLERLDSYGDYQRSLSKKLTHELRTPLAIIRSSLENLALRGDTGEDECLQRALTGVERLGSTLTAMTSVSRIEESISQADRQYFSLSHLVSELVQAYSQLHPQVQVRLCCDEREDILLFGNPELMAQLLDKLVDNAVDYCPPSGVIELGVAREDGGIELWVSNEGRNLDGVDTTRLFSALYSLREDDGRLHLGLGLYVVRLIADFHQGSVSARSLGDASGARFSVYFSGSRH